MATNDALFDYIAAQRSRGVADEAIRRALLENGWQLADVSAALTDAASPIAAAQATSAIAAVGMTFTAKIAIASAALLGVAAIGGGGYYAYRTILQPKLTPEQVIRKMMEHSSADVTSLEYETKLEVTGAKKAPAPEDFRATFEMNGAMDVRDLKQRRFVGTARFTFNTSSFGSGELLLEEKTFEKATYLRLNTLSITPNAQTVQWANLGPILDSFLEPLKGQWVRFDEKTKEMLQGFVPKTPAQPDVEQLQKEILANEEQFTQAWKRAAIVTVTSTLLEEAIDGTKTYHYAIAPDYAGIEQYFTEILPLVPQQFFGSAEGGREKASAMLKNIPEASKHVDIAGEIWIGRKDFLLRKLLIKIRNKDEREGTLAATVTFVGKNYNKPVVIEEPKDAKSFEEFLEELKLSAAKLAQDEQLKKSFAELLGPKSPPEESKESADHDNDGLTDEEEARYGTDPNTPDTDGDGYSDGDEVKNGFNPNGAGKLESSLQRNKISATMKLSEPSRPKQATAELPVVVAPGSTTQLARFLPPAPAGWKILNDYILLGIADGTTPGRPSGAKRVYAKTTLEESPSNPLTVGILDHRGVAEETRAIEMLDRLATEPISGVGMVEKTTVRGLPALEVEGRSGPGAEMISLNIVLKKRFGVRIGDVPKDQKEVLYRFANLIDYRAIEALP